MNNFISRIFVLSLLFSFVYAQDASGIKKGSNDEKVSVKKEQKKSSRDGSAARLNNDDTQSGSGSSASKKAGAGGGKATFLSDVTPGGDVSGSLGKTGSFDRLEGVTLNATNTVFASGSDVISIQAKTGAFDNGDPRFIYHQRMFLPLKKFCQ